MIMLGFSLLLGGVVCGLIFFSSWGVGFSGKGLSGGRSVFECGFDPSSGARSGISMRFFLLLILFLVFDVEIVIVLPFVGFSGVFSSWWVLGLGGVFLLLVVGLIYEWVDGSLKWMK